MALAENGASNETIRLLETRSSVRSFTPDPVSEEMIVAVLEAARRAPTSSNMQAYSFVVVREEETRRKLSVLAGNQPFVAKAPVFVAVCADLSQIACVCEKYGKTLSGQSLDIGMRAVIDAALAGMTASLVESGVPVMELALRRLDAATLGALFVLFETTVALLGLMRGVDPFDQPAVEDAKTFTAGLLGRSDCAEDARRAEDLLADRKPE